MRNTREDPFAFEQFPETATCAVCGTNDEGKCVLVPIDGTSDGSISEAMPVHLGCAIPTNANKMARVLYVRFKE
jgi:hypothetical protein